MGFLKDKIQQPNAVSEKEETRIQKNMSWIAL
jgi:hypothetical protein